MKKALRSLLLAGLLAAMVAPAAFAAGPPEKLDSSFVCPVLGGKAGLNAPEDGPITALGDTGDYTVGGPSVSVPVFATNDGGAGQPAGDHASPGDTTYTAIWSGLQ
jgi:hypothetical protein